MDQSQAQGYLIPLPSFEQRVEARLASIEARLARDAGMAAARIEDLNQQLAEQNGYIKKLEMCIKELGSSLPERGA